MIELFAADTPNGKKISIMLEEIGFKYKVTKINLLEGEQFKPDFRKISPFSKIPVIIDSTNNNETIFESGAILIYLGERSKKFYDIDDRLKINQWLMAQMGYVGEERYFKITKSIYKDLDERLGQSKYLSGENYSIADIATWPWIARHEWHDIGLKNYKNLTRWYLEIADREAVINGYNFMDKEAKIPLP